MTDYNELVAALRECGERFFCDGCPIFETCDGDVDRAMHDAADAIEALRFELDCVNDSIKQLALPVDGKWVRVEDGESYHYECSECGERPLYSRYGDVSLSGVCPMCGAKMIGEQNVE